MPRLQVRQLSISQPIGEVIYTRGEWIDVPSPGWLIGFVLPHPGFAYQFRNAPETD